MYISTVVTVSSTAIIATMTASPLRTPGPSDTPIFSVVSPPTTSASAKATAAVGPIDVTSTATTTTTATATVTVTAAGNRSPYPGFNANNYPHQNFTEAHGPAYKNSTNMLPVMYSNCTNTVPVLYTSGKQTFNRTINPSESKNSGVEVICEGRNVKNGTEHAHVSGGEGVHGSSNSTAVGRGKSMVSVTAGARSTPYVGAGYDSISPAEARVDEMVADEDGDLAGWGGSSDVKTKRETGGAVSDEYVPAYVRALERGPVI